MPVWLVEDPLYWLCFEGVFDYFLSLLETTRREVGERNCPTESLKLRSRVCLPTSRNH